MSTHPHLYLLLFINLFILFIYSLCSHPRLADVVHCLSSSSSTLISVSASLPPLALQPTRRLINMPKRYSELIRMASEFK